MSLLSSTLYLAVGAVLAVGAGSWGDTQPAATSAELASLDDTPAARVPADLIITNPRVCAAVEVYQLAQVNDWGLRTTVASTALNSFRNAGSVPDCSARLKALMARDFSWSRWQESLDAVDAVSSGSYSISPDACARANTIVPLTIVPDSPPDATSVAALAQCVIYDLAFVEVRS
ncbi:MAG: hypothetical protein ACREP4_01135 [Stenotrophomonas sp.]|uniref:hypothetical protein n=1 Tax=Stenotrophomonas sp. TaxID=69392 RepID=UPI003D6D7000